MTLQVYNYYQKIMFNVNQNASGIKINRAVATIKERKLRKMIKINKIFQGRQST